MSVQPGKVLEIDLPLAERLRERIRREGPITFRDWMDAALYDESEGYYCRGDRVRWGRAGDYRTSPERSPLFAATFAKYFAKLYDEMGAPPEWTILEAGAGAGHFARGVLEGLARWHPRAFTATRYVIDDVSANARQHLRELLRQFEERVEFRQLAEMKEPIRAGIIFSNEMLDSMPVHRVIMRRGKLFELCVGANETNEFYWTEQKPAMPRLEAYFEDSSVCLEEGQIADVNLASGDWLCLAASSLSQGYVITVDYGADAQELYNPSQRREGTLRAFRQHRFAQNILAEPGTQDITCTIDWRYLKRAGELCGLEALSLERQDEFLMKEGLLDQLQDMITNAPSDADRVILSTGAREMILPDGMSASFQVLVQRCVNHRL